MSSYSLVQNRTYTYTHSVTYVSEKILLCLKEIVREIGLNPSRLSEDWEVLQKGISTWLESRHLARVHLEIYDPNGSKLVRRWDFDIEYDYPGSDSFWADTADIRYHLQKAGFVPDRCEYRVIASTREGSPDVPGWSSCTFLSTDSLSQHSIGTTIFGNNGLASKTAYWR